MKEKARLGEKEKNNQKILKKIEKSVDNKTGKWYTKKVPSETTEKKNKSYELVIYFQKKNM